MNVGTRIKERRQELNISVDELATRLNKNRTTIYRYEKGDIENLPMTVLGPLAKALDTTPAYLMGWDDIPNKDTATIGDLLRMIRIDQNMTIEEYSKEMGITEKNLRMYESGEKDIPLSVIKTIAGYYKLSRDSLLKSWKCTEEDHNRWIKHFKTWADNIGNQELTDAEHAKIIEYTNFLLYIREK